MIHVISVSKSYSHRGNHKHKSGTKKRWHLYYIDEEGKLRTKRINFLQAIYYKTQKKHRYKAICQDCGSQFIVIVRLSGNIVLTVLEDDFVILGVY